MADDKIQCSVCDKKHTNINWHKFKKKIASNKENFSFGVRSELLPTIDYVCDECYPNCADEYKNDNWIEEKIKK